MSDFILIKTNKQYVEVYNHLKSTLLDLDEKELGESGHERFGLNIGGGEYYSFGDFRRFTIELIRNQGEVENFEREWPYSVWFNKRELDELHYQTIKEKVARGLGQIGMTKWATQTDYASDH